MDPFCVCKRTFCSIAAFWVNSVDWCRWWEDVGCPLGVLLNDLHRLSCLNSSFRSRTQLLLFSLGRDGESFSLVGSSLEVKSLIDHYSLRPWNRSIKFLTSYTSRHQGLGEKQKALFYFLYEPNIARFLKELRAHVNSLGTACFFFKQCLIFNNSEYKASDICKDV